MERYSKWMVLVLAFALMLPAGLWAQGGATGAVSVTVLDEKGGTIPGAKVVLTNKDTREKVREGRTTDPGTFTFTSLVPGTYMLEITKDGFATYAADNVVVKVTETAAVVATMKIGSVSEVLTVSEAAAPVQLTSATTGQTLGAQTIGNLPLSTGNMLTLLTLSAGANTELFDNAALGRGAVTINVNGQRPVNNNYQLEGINSNDVNLPILDNVPLPNPRTIGEFKAQTSLYDASQGRNGGGNIQVNLKSGASQYHGDAYEFLRNNVLNANDWFLNRQSEKRPVLRQNQFGGSFGGPVPWTKEFFFFTNYQGSRAASGASAGTFFATSIPILPATRNQATLTAAFFPSGLPPGFTQLDPQALAWLNLPASKCPIFNDGTLCVPSLPGTPGLTSSGSVRLATITKAGLGTFQDDQFVTTVDKQITSKDKLTGRFFFSNNALLQPFGGAATLPFARNLPGSNRFLKAGWTRTFSNNIVNDFRYGFSRFTFSRVPDEPISLTDIGATRANSAQFPGAYEIIISGAFSLGTGVNDVRSAAINTFVWADDLSIVHGRHVFRIGGEISRYQLNRTNEFGSRGSVSFANTIANDPSAGIPALKGFQNFLLGRVTGTQAGAGFFTFHFRALDAAAYFQDDWKIRPRFTVNLGLRWEGTSTANEKDNFLSNFLGVHDGTTGPLSIIHPAQTANVGTPGVSRCTLLHCFDYKNFAPRAGFAWDVFGDQKTALRGGYGLYYQRVSNQPLLQTSGGLPFSQAISATKFSVTMANPFPSILPSSAFPLPFDQVVPALTGFNGTTGRPIFQSANGGPLSGFFFFPVRDFSAPYAQQWNLGIERQLFKGWVMEVGYVGTHGVRLLGVGGSSNPGQICTAARPCVIPPRIGQSVNVPAGTPFVVKNADGSISITASTAANINARVPVSYLGLANARGRFGTQDGNSIYHSLQATLSHQFSAGLYFQGAYTYAKAIDNSSGSTFTDELNGFIAWGDYIDHRRNRGPADFDRTHRLVLTYNYELPFARWMGIADHGFGKIVNGWAINGVTTFQSGTPFSVFDSGAVTLQDTDFVETTNFALIPAGQTIQSLYTTGSEQNRVGGTVNGVSQGQGFVDLTKFSSSPCVDNQNVGVPFTIPNPTPPPATIPNPACTGFAPLGNVGRNAFRGPFQQNWDMGILKVTKLTERVAMDFRAELFNVFNHPSFQSPQAGGGSFGNYGLVDVPSGDSSILGTASRPRIIQFALLFRF